ncbi:MAG: helix-turn-helix domain-containing protein [Alphaproteobacteria bacterium]|nr:helix-turn-helix domain-containing protein [Alphaproteobacteria bacterium]
MAMPKDMRAVARQRFDETFRPPPDLERFQHPVGGWLRSVREMLGISLKDAARNAGITPQSLLATEKGELRGSVSLASMGRAANAIGCDFVCFVMPRGGTMEELHDKIARHRAKADLDRTARTMALENQALSPKRLEDIARDHARPRKGRVGS